MKKFIVLLAAAFLALTQAQGTTTTTTTCQPQNETSVRGLFNLWNNALATLNSTTVANRYARRAVLLPTVSDVPRNTTALIVNYFDDFLKKKPQGVILSGDITMGCNWAQDAGIYEFTMGADGSKVKARYSYVYVWEDGQWRISHHHSSVMPEGFLKAASSSAGFLKISFLMIAGLVALFF